MTADSRSLTRPLPFFHHTASARVLYLAPGPCPLVFSISLKNVGRHAPVVEGQVVHKTTHPFGHSTEVASLAADSVRRDLADATPLASGALDETLARWASFCDDVADRLNDGDGLAAALDETWVLGEGEDVDLDDDSTTPAAVQRLPRVSRLPLDPAP